VPFAELVGVDVATPGEPPRLAQIDAILVVVDVTNKSNMFLVSRYFYSTPAYSHQGWLSEDRQYFYLNDELDESNQGYTTRTRVIDVSDIDSPFQAGWFTTGSSAIDHNLYTKGDLIFEANYRSGLRVFDISTAACNAHLLVLCLTPPVQRRAALGANA